MNQTIEGGRKRTVKVQKVSREDKIFARLDEYGVYWDKCIPDKAVAERFLHRLRRSERLAIACLRLQKLNITIELEEKFVLKSNWVKVNVFSADEKIIQFLTLSR